MDFLLHASLLLTCTTPIVHIIVMKPSKLGSLSFPVCNVRNITSLSSRL